MNENTMTENPVLEELGEKAKQSARHLRSLSAGVKLYSRWREL